MPSGAMRSVDARHFSMVPRNDVQRSAFDVMHTHKTTFNATYLIPVYVDEVLPGDSYRLKMHAFARLSTPIVPVLDNLVLESFFFFVPNRLVWANWERFMGEQLTVSDTTAFLTPYVQPTNVQAGVATIYDYFGITIQAAGSVAVQSMPFRAYNLIWNEFFRDQDLQNPVVVSTGDGPDAATDFQLLARNKRHDYFTTARPWPAKPTTAQATSSLNSLGVFSPGQDMVITQFGGGVGAPVTGISVASGQVSTAGPFLGLESGVRGASYGNVHLFSNMRALAIGTGASAPDIKVLVNDLRTSVMLQSWMEKNARGGTRYAEIVRSHFGVVSPDARLQRPEFLGGGRSFISVNPVNQTSATGLTGGTTELGEQAGTGVVSVYGHGFSQSFTEHGFIIGMVNVRGDLTYQQGIERMWFRRTQFDFYWPSLAHLGEQAILRKELFCNAVTADDNSVFGYQERWAEYKYKPSRTSSYFRSSVATPLDMWHFAQEFPTTAFASLNAAFMVDEPAVGRVLQVTGNFGQQFLMDSLFEVRKVRPMPMYSIPGVGARL